MITKKIFPLIFIAILALSFQAQGQTGFSSYWNNGFKVESDDGQFKLKFGGRIMFDAAYLDFEDMVHNSAAYGAEMRRARIFNSGTIYQNFYYKWQVDIGGNKVSIKDMYLGIQNIPVIGKVQAGNFKEPFRLDALTSSKYITFMERSLSINYITERNLGVMVLNELDNHRLGWQLGVFRGTEGSSLEATGEMGVAITGRLTGLPLYQPDDRSFLHLGASFSHRFLDGHNYQVASRPESNLAPVLIATGNISGLESLTLAGGEVAFVTGPFSAQGEFVAARPKKDADATGPEFALSTFYGQVSYFLTGESRSYKNSYGGFDRIKPKKNLGDGGCGAFELAFRFSQSDISTTPATGGTGNLNDLTAGMNWYLNPAMRVMLNYVHTFFNEAQMPVSSIESGNAFQMRFQADF